MHVISCICDRPRVVSAESEVVLDVIKEDDQPADACHEKDRFQLSGPFDLPYLGIHQCVRKTRSSILVNGSQIAGHCVQNFLLGCRFPIHHRMISRGSVIVPAHRLLEAPPACGRGLGWAGSQRCISRSAPEPHTQRKPPRSEWDRRGQVFRAGCVRGGVVLPDRGQGILVAAAAGAAGAGAAAAVIIGPVGRRAG